MNPDNNCPTSASAYCAFLALLCCTLCVSAPAFGQLIWSQEFDSGSAPDSSVWTYELGAGGWGNQELQEYTNKPDNARVEGGYLVISAREKVSGSSSSGFTSARLITENKLMLKYGSIEARIKVPDLADGLWPAFWTLGNNFSEVGWPACGEVDITEMGWKDAVRDQLVNRWVGSAAHWEHQGSHAFFGRTYSAQAVESTDMNEDFHIFKMNWTPDSITTYIDGVEKWNMDITAQNCTDCEEFHQPHFILLNLAVGGSFTGLLSHTQINAPLPADMLIDYVRIYNNGFTQLSGSSLDNVPPVIGPAHSGSWYNGDQSGHGFSIEFGQLADGTPLAVVYWYTYDDQGNPIFMLGTGTPEDNRVEISFNSPVGMIYGDFDPDSVVREVGGSAVLEFTDRNNGSFSYTPSAFASANWGHTTAIEALPLVKLFGIPAPDYFLDPE